MDAKKRAEGIPEAERKAVWHELGLLLHKSVGGGVHTNDDTPPGIGDDSGNTPTPPPPPGH